jgi:hypothetical protein
MSDKSHVGMSRCFYCLDFSEVLLDKRLKDSLPKDCGVISMRPCHKCEDHMEQGVILIGYDEDANDFEALERERVEWFQDDRNLNREFIPDAKRSGHFAVVKDDFITRNIAPETLSAQILRLRWSFMPSSIMTQLIRRIES